jgi:hypothetical protein
LKTSDSHAKKEQGKGGKEGIGETEEQKQKAKIDSKPKDQATFYNKEHMQRNRARKATRHTATFQRKEQPQDENTAPLLEKPPESQQTANEENNTDKKQPKQPKHHMRTLRTTTSTTHSKTSCFLAPNKKTPSRNKISEYRLENKRTTIAHQQREATENTARNATKKRSRMLESIKKSARMRKLQNTHMRNEATTSQTRTRYKPNMI